MIFSSSSVAGVFILAVAAVPAAAKRKNGKGGKSGKGEFCPKLHRKGVLELGINMAFLDIDEYDTTAGGKADALVVTSFFNFNSVQVLPDITVPVPPPFAADQVGIVRDLNELDPEEFDSATNFERLTDLGQGMPTQVWPNEAKRVPDGVLPFEAIVLPQGFHSALLPGRLTIINLDDPDRQEYIVHQSTLRTPRFYHEALFYDMNDDGLKDIVTVRSGFRVGAQFNPPFSELVYFVNPGTGLDPAQEWEDVVLYGGPSVGFLGPDLFMDMADIDWDGVPEIVATHLFSVGTGPGQPTGGIIAIYGPPQGQTWSQVNMFNLARQKIISDNSRGFPFDVKFVDLDGDGRMEVLATNHQGDACTPDPTTPGQVYALEQPNSGLLFDDEWSTHVLLDGIRPQPTVYQNPQGSRLAPGFIIPFFSKEKYAGGGMKLRGKKGGARPWILVSGNEAGKVWMMKPKGGNGLDYETTVIFDINDYYGPETTQMLTPDRLVTISTIGKPAIRYVKKSNNKKGAEGVAEIYIPVFEAGHIHIISFKKEKGQRKIACPADVTLECPAP